MSERIDWIKKAQEITNLEEAKELALQIQAQKGINLLAEYASGQNIAKGYLKIDGEIPPGLLWTIQSLAELPSGFTNLSVHMAYTEKISKE